MMCIPLYDDIASIIFGLYENNGHAEWLPPVFRSVPTWGEYTICSGLTKNRQNPDTFGVWPVPHIVSATGFPPFKMMGISMEE
jgi:hypothetical protein